MGVAWAHLPADTRRAVYPNGYHLLMRDLDRQAVINDVIAWIRRPGRSTAVGRRHRRGAAWAHPHTSGGWHRVLGCAMKDGRRTRSSAG